MSAVLDAAFNLAHDYPGGAAALAVRVQRNPTTLSHELKRQGSAKLGLDDACKMSALTGDLRILNAFAASCNALVVPMAPSEGDADSFGQLSQLAREFADVVAAQSEALADGRVTYNELRKLEREWSELVACGQRLQARARALYEAGLPFAAGEGGA